MKILPFLYLTGGLSLKLPIFLILFVSLTAEAADAHCDKTLTVHLDLHAPSAYLDNSGQVVGMDALLTQRILTQAGCQVRWHLTPMTGARILRSLQQGMFDVMIRASKTPERQEYAYFSQPYRHEVVALFSRKHLKLPATLSMADAFNQGLRLIGPATGWYGNEFEALRAKWKQKEFYTPYPDATRATELLFAEPSRGDLLLVDADIFFLHLGEERYHQVSLVGNNVLISPALLMFSQHAIEQTDLRAINQAILQLRQTGELVSIENNYRPQALQKLLSGGNQLH